MIIAVTEVTTSSMPQIKASWRLQLNQNQLIHVIKSQFDWKNIAATVLSYELLIISPIQLYGK